MASFSLEHLIKGTKIKRRPGCSLFDINDFENKTGFALPAELREFYLQTDGIFYERPAQKKRSVPLVLSLARQGEDYQELVEMNDYYVGLIGVNIADFGILPITPLIDADPFCVICKGKFLGKIIRLWHDDTPTLEFGGINSFLLSLFEIGEAGEWEIDNIRSELGRVRINIE